MKNIYLECKKKKDKEIEKFPMAFAFNEEQFDKALEKLGVKSSQELVSIGAGGMIRKIDITAFNEMTERWDDEHEEHLKDETFVYQMFYDELANHEYCVNEDYWDTLEACELSEETVNNTPMLKKMLLKATKEYMKNVENC